jgi:hypothetical protein
VLFGQHELLFERRLVLFGRSPLLPGGNLQHHRLYRGMLLV